MKITVNVAEQIKEAQNIMDDCNEAISVLDNAIACRFLEDKHNFAIQEWIKEYKKRIEELREFIENARTNG